MLRGLPGSAEFMVHDAELLAPSENAVADMGASRIQPGTIDAVVVKYLKHEDFTQRLAKATQATRRPILDNFRQCRTPSGYPLRRDQDRHAVHRVDGARLDTRSADVRDRVLTRRQQFGVVRHELCAAGEGPATWSS